MTVEHRTIDFGERHGAANWIVLTGGVAALAAISVSEDDIGKQAWVAGRGHYVLAAVSPTVWELVAPAVKAMAFVEETGVLTVTLTDGTEFTVTIPQGTDEDAVNSLIATALTDYYTADEIDTTLAGLVSDVGTALSGKEPIIAAGTSAQYWRGDKSWQTLDADVVAETASRVYLSPAQKTVATQAASAVLNGYLSSTDWSAFNGKQAALADVVTAGAYGSSTQVPVVTVNAKGIVTAVTLTTIAAPVLTEANFSVAKTGQPTYKVTWVLTALTGAKTWTVPDTNLDFGNIAKIPAVATPYTTGSMAGTRSQCVGGSGNTFSGGTDNIAIGCTNCTMNGARNAAYGCTKIGLASTATDNSFYNCVSTQPVELLTTIGVRYVNCSFAQLQATNSIFGGIWPNYSTVEATNEYGATKCTVGLTSINFDSYALTPLTTAGTGSTEVLAYKEVWGQGISVHDIIITCFAYNNTAGAVFRRTVVINSVGTIVSTATPVADVTYGGTTYTPAISVVGRILRITVASSVSSDSGAYATVTSLYL